MTDTWDVFRLTGRNANIQAMLVSVPCATAPMALTTKWITGLHRTGKHDTLRATVASAHNQNIQINQKTCIHQTQVTSIPENIQKSTNMWRLAGWWQKPTFTS